MTYKFNQDDNWKTHIKILEDLAFKLCGGSNPHYDFEKLAVHPAVDR